MKNNESVKKLEKMGRGSLVIQIIIFAWLVLTVMFNKSTYDFLSFYGAGGASIAAYLGLVIFFLMTIVLLVADYKLERG